MPIIERISSFQKLIIGIAIAAIICFLVAIKGIDELSHVMIGWDSFSVCMIVMSWITFFITNSKQIPEQSKIQNPRQSIVFVIIIISTLAGFLAVL